MDAESFGPEALSEVQILEKRTPSVVQAAMPATLKAQSSPMPGFGFVLDNAILCRVI